MRLQNKIALVTGASSGIGLAIAKRFAHEGARVAVNYRDEGKGDDAVAAVRAEARGGDPEERVIGVCADVSRREQVEAMFTEIAERWGRVDVCVNNAGIEIKRGFLEISDDEWDQVLRVNLYGPFVVSQVAARAMVDDAIRGRIVNISSVHEDIPFADYTPYCASKGGLRMMMRNLALELAPHGITVNNIAPGAIATPINQEMLDSRKARRETIEEIPLGRIGAPEDVAAVALFLASDEAGYVTGSTYYVDGGMVQQVTKH